MLGDLVEHDFSLAAETPMALGQSIGTIEGFKAVSEIFGVAMGIFAGGNSALNIDPTLLDSDPYDQGWLYEVRGEPDPSAMGAKIYTTLLDAQIDRILESSHGDEGGDACPIPGTS